jgi:transposase
MSHEGRTMCLKPIAGGEVPEETVRIARAAYPNGNRYMMLRDELGTIFSDEQFQVLFEQRGQAAESPWRLALVSVLQFMEDLSDRQAADAVRASLDWKYLLSLPLEDAGFDHTVLSEFRTRLVERGAEQLVFELVLEQMKGLGLLKAGGRQRTDSTHVLGVIRALNRLECVGETLRHALNVLAVVVPDWMRSHSQAEWLERYGRRVDDYHLPKAEGARLEYAQQMCADGQIVLDALSASDAPVWLSQLPALQTLRTVWTQNYRQEAGQLHWRSNDDIPAASEYIGSPYDVQAHYSKKGTTAWVGHKVHLTETYDEDSPHLITNVETTTGPVADGEVTTPIHAALQQRDLLPTQHIMDTGYLDAPLLVRARQDYQIDLLGPTRSDVRWQARAGQGFDATHFAIDWQARQAICPSGRRSLNWTPAIDNRDNKVIKIKFSRKDCVPCPVRILCTRAKRRTVTIRPDGQYQALVAARQREATDTFRHEYARRAGIEGTLSQGVRTCGLRRSRYVGLPKTSLQHLLIATALNLARLAEWLTGNEPAKTRQSAFVRLYFQPST